MLLALVLQTQQTILSSLHTAMPFNSVLLCTQQPAISFTQAALLCSSQPNPSEAQFLHICCSLFCALSKPLLILTAPLIVRTPHGSSTPHHRYSYYRFIRFTHCQVPHITK